MLIGTKPWCIAVKKQALKKGSKGSSGKCWGNRAKALKGAQLQKENLASLVLWGG